MKRSNSEVGFLTAIDDMAKSYDFTNFNFQGQQPNGQASALFEAANSGTNILKSSLHNKF